MNGVGRVGSPSWPTPVLFGAAERAASMYKLAIQDGREFWYADYKEPLAPFAGGFGFVGTLGKDDEGRVLCHYCGKTYLNLGAHAAKMHGLPAREYKNETGLLQSSALVSERTRFLNAAHALRRNLGQNLQARPDANVIRLRAAKKGGAVCRDGRGRIGQRSPEALNKSGRCLEQVKAVARRVMSEKGRITEAEMRRRGISYRIIETYFGDWPTFLRLMGDTTRKRAGLRVTNDELLITLRSLAQELGRTPMHTDMRRFAMHDAGVYVKRWGSWKAAIEAAGLPYRAIGSWIEANVSESDASALLASYAVTGSFAKTARKFRTNDQTVIDILGRYGISPLPNGSPERYRQMELAEELASRISGIVA